MKKSQQIINIIEGFKLGSLGAGVKIKPVEEPKVVVPEPEPIVTDRASDRGYRVLKTLWTKQKRDFSDWWVDAVRWSEINGVSLRKYHLFMVCRIVNDNARYQIQLLGGTNLTSVLTSNPHAKDADFMCNFVFSASSDKEADDVFHSKFTRIVGMGSFGYAVSIGKLGTWKISTASHIEDYLKATTGLPTSNYLKTS